MYRYAITLKTEVIVEKKMYCVCRNRWSSSVNDLYLLHYLVEQFHDFFHAILFY